MKDKDDDKPTSTISLAAETQRRERDFSAERADLLAELREIGVEEPELAALVQHIMVIEWSVFHAARMLEYHDIERSPDAIVELVRIMTRSVQPL